MIEIEIFTFVTVWHIVLDEKTSILPVSELFRPQIFSPNLSKMAILDYRILVTVYDCFSCFFFELSQGFKNAKRAPVTPFS